MNFVGFGTEGLGDGVGFCVELGHTGVLLCSVHLVVSSVGFCLILSSLVPPCHFVGVTVIRFDTCLYKYINKYMCLLGSVCCPLQEHRGFVCACKNYCAKLKLA